MSSILDLFRNLFDRRYHGVYPAQVTNIEDPNFLGRVLVSLPALGGSPPGEQWARIATLMAGDQRGTWFIPEVDDEVLVAFEDGDPQKPYVLGSLWNSEHLPPEQMDASGENPVKSIHTRSGIVVSLYDVTNEEALVMKTPGGQSLVLQDGKGGSVEITDASGNQIRLSSTGIEINASVNLKIVSSAKVSVNASTVEVNAGAVQVNAGMSTFSGVVKAETLITNSVISSSYTPGVGNIS